MGPIWERSSSSDHSHLARPLRHDHLAGTAVARVEDEVENLAGLSVDKFGPEDSLDIKQLYKSFTTDARHIKAFDGNKDKFTNWRKAIGDQMQRQRPWINKLLEWARKQQKPITSEIEQGLAEASFNVNEASQHIWDFLVIHIGEKQQRFRNNIEATLEPGRGLELWRLLLDEFDSQALAVARQKNKGFMDPRQTKGIDTLEHDLDKWLELGAEIENVSTYFHHTPTMKAAALYQLSHE